MIASIKNSIRRFSVLGAGLIVALAAIELAPVQFVSEARADAKRSGVILGGSQHRYSKYKRHGHRNKASHRLGYRKSGSLGYGKHKGKKSYRKHAKRHHYHNRGDIQFIDRRRKIEAYNRSIRKERAGVVYSTNSGVASIYVPYERQGIISSGYSDTGVAGPVIVHTEPCPKHHNCGYRLYDDGTGPRIITPGVSAGNGLPPFDGLSGPRVITPNG